MLDPSTGECKPMMIYAYLKQVHEVNEPECRLLAKAYLKCGMDSSKCGMDISRSVPLPAIYGTYSAGGGEEEKPKSRGK